MNIVNNVVGKLWLTIMGLVALVLIILGLFLFGFIDTSFPKTDDQAHSLRNLANKIAVESGTHRGDDEYSLIMNELLKAQDAGMFIVNRKQPQFEQQIVSPDGRAIKLSDIYTHDELSRILLLSSDGGKQFRLGVESAYTDYVVEYVPVMDRLTGEVSEILFIFQSLKSVDQTQLYVKKLFAFVAFIGFLLTTFFAFFLITRITRPLTQLKEAADTMSQGHFHIRVPVVSSDEIGDLTNTFNLMGERLEETIKDLNHEKENLTSVLGSMSDAVISFDVQGKIIFTNPHGQQLIKDWQMIQWDEAESKDDKQIPQPLHQLYEEVVQATKEVSTKLHIQNGVWSIVMAPLYSQASVRGVVAVLREVTEEHRLEKLRKDFVANVSHELRTPISMLQGYSEALLDDIATSPEDRNDLVQVIHDESLRMGRLVNDLLDLARMEAGHMELNFRTVEANHLVRRIQRKFVVLAKEREIILELQLVPGELMLEHADEDRLEQVLTNLMDNAIRHTASGARIVLRSLVDLKAESPSVILEVEDEGIGIPAVDLPFIFERFYKADKARTRGQTGGTGLGLAIVTNIVEAHQGFIQVKSKVGHGTTFSITIPVSPER